MEYKKFFNTSEDQAQILILIILAHEITKNNLFIYGRVVSLIRLMLV